MSPTRRSHRIEFFVIAVFAISIAVSMSGTRVNVTSNLVGLSAPITSESTTLNCTGLTGVRGVAPGAVEFVNTSAIARHVDATVASSSGSARLVSFVVGANSSFTLASSQFPGASYYGVSAVVSGAGVTASETVASPTAAPVACVSASSANWFFSGLSTHVGNAAILTLLNATSTPANVNVTVVTSSGTNSPASFQGVVVAAHGESTVALGSQIVNTSQFSTVIHAVQGSVVASVIESWNTQITGASIVAGSSELSRDVSFADVSTNNGVQSDVALCNPSTRAANVSVEITVPGYSITPFTTSLAPQSTAEVLISPTTRVPIAGAAVLRVRSNVAICSQLVSRLTSGPALWFNAPGVASTAQLLVDDATHPLVSLTVLNAGRSSAQVTLGLIGVSGVPQTITLSAGSSRIFSASTTGAWIGRSILVTSSSPVIASATQGGPTNGALVQDASGGR